MKRRDFFCGTAGALGALRAWGADLGEHLSGSTPEGAKVWHSAQELLNMPNFCAHEHWGSIAAVGGGEDGFRADTEAGACPVRPVSVWDLVLDPYGGGWMHSGGTNPDQLARDGGGGDSFAAWWAVAPEAAFSAIRPHLEHRRLTGVFKCTARGVRFLHGVDLAQLGFDDWLEADKRIGAAYGDLHAWHRSAMKSAAFSGLIRPVHPLYYWRAENAAAAAAERAYCGTILRIDPLVRMWREKCPARDELAQATGVDPVDVRSWREFIGRICDRAAANGGTGIKQLQAYSRDLDFSVVDGKNVRFRGELDETQQRAFGDWVVHECCRQAHDRGWPHQVHVGTNNLTESGPLPLEALARRYPKMNVVMLHCWPFLSESGYLAKMCPNMFADTCWQPILNPEFLHRSFMEWLGYVPLHKIMCSQDATSVEMAVGSSQYQKEMLLFEIEGECGGMSLDQGARRGAALALLHNNAVRVYGVGEAVNA